MNQNLTQKLIRSHLAAGTMVPGQEIALRIDQTLTQDALGMLSYIAFESFGMEQVKTELSVSYLDHNMVYLDYKNPDDHAYLMTMGKKYGIHVSRPGNGICHLVHCSRFAVPGKTLIGTDSHTPTSGALGMLAIGAGGIDVAAAMAGEPFYLKMPRVVGIRLTGSLKPGVGAKDLALEITRRFTVKGGTGCVLEYFGPGLAGLSVPQRMTLANMGTETGATSSVFPADEQVKRYLKAQKREKDYCSLAADPCAEYDQIVEMDLGAIDYMVAAPHQPDQVKPVRELEKISVDQVYIGSCTNSSYVDLKTAALILRGHVVPEHVSLIVSPGSRQNYQMLVKEGLLEDFILAGARILECGCGPCVGMGQAVSTGGVSLRTSNRNFKGRCGTQDSYVYLSGPAVAAASAAAGYITVPGELAGDEEAAEYKGRSALLESVEVQEPEEYFVDDQLIICPASAGEREEIVVRRGPNIRPVPVIERENGPICGHVVKKLGDHVSTDEIAPTGPQYGALRANVPEAAKTAFIRSDPGFYKRAVEYGKSVIVAGDNYGQGSSREHAALLPAYLGVKAVLAVSFARIHRTNLINFGVLPLEFENPKDLELISEGAILRIYDAASSEMEVQCVESERVNMESAISERGRTETAGIKEKGFYRVEIADSGITIPAVCNLTKREEEIYAAGGLLNLIRQRA